MEAVVRSRPITAEEFWELSHQLDSRVELVNGRVAAMPPAGPEHGRVDRKLVIPLGSYVEAKGLGEVYLNTGFTLRRDPDVTRGPDQAFVSAARIAESPPPEHGFWELAPDLAVEIVSPGDTASEMREKIEEYLQAGVRIVWAVYPRQRQVIVYYPSGDARILREDCVLEGEEVIPGFRLPLSELWS